MATIEDKAKSYDAIAQIVRTFIEDVEGYDETSEEYNGVSNEIYASYGMQRMQEIRAEIVGLGDECEEIPVPVNP